MDDWSPSLEQQYLLARIYLEAQTMSRAELADALCDSWLTRFQLKAIFESYCREHQLGFRIEEARPVIEFETEEDFMAVFGCIPTEEEARAYFRSLEEVATMELDMDEIVLTPDDGVS